MENLETYLYIFFAVIYIISRILKTRSKQNQSQNPAPNPQQQAKPHPLRKTARPKKAFSFEDILKEFEKNISGENIEQEEAFPVREIKHEIPEPVAVKTIKKDQSPYKLPKYDSVLSKPQNIERERPVFKRNEKFEIKENVASEYVKMLQDPEGFRNAVVLSEIINRKYF